MQKGLFLWRLIYAFMVWRVSLRFNINSDRGSGFSYGAGAEMDIAPNVSVGADYMRYLDKSAYDFDVASIGLSYRF